MVASAGISTNANAIAAAPPANAGKGRHRVATLSELVHRHDFRGLDRFALPLSDDDVRAVRFYRPADDSVEMKYLRARRASLGGARRGGRRSGGERRRARRS